MSLSEWVRYAKKFCVALVAALSLAGTLVADGSVSASDGIAIALAFAGALGVYKVENEYPETPAEDA